MAMAARATTPFPAVGRALAGAGGRDPAGALYLAILPRVGGLLADPDRYRFLWEPEWARVEADAALIDAGGATVEDHPGADLAIVRAPRPLHDMAVHPRADSMRVAASPDRARPTTRYGPWGRGGRGFNRSSSGTACSRFPRRRRRRSRSGA